MSVDETLMCSFQILKPARKMLGGSATKSGFKVCMANKGKVVIFCPMQVYIYAAWCFPTVSLPKMVLSPSVISTLYIILSSLNLQNDLK